MRIRLAARGPESRMNVQRRPRCTFILSPSTSYDGKSLK